MKEGRGMGEEGVGRKVGSGEERRGEREEGVGERRKERGEREGRREEREKRKGKGERAGWGKGGGVGRSAWVTEDQIC